MWQSSHKSSRGIQKIQRKKEKGRNREEDKNMAGRQRRYRRGELAFEILEELLNGVMFTVMIVAALSGGAVGW